MNIDERAPDIFRLSLYVPEINIEFNQFLLRDDEPLLLHVISWIACSPNRSDPGNHKNYHEKSLPP